MEEQALVNLVSFRGPIGCGKTFASKYFEKRFGYKRISFADALKIETFNVLWHGMEEGLVLFEKSMADLGKHIMVRDFPKPDRDIRGRDLYYIQDDEKTTWINEHKTTLRPLLQWWGTEYRRMGNEEYWVSKWVEKITPILLDGGLVVVDDARFDNEIDLIVRLHGIHIYLETDATQREQRLTARDGITNLGISGHASEGTSEKSDDRNSVIIKNIAGSIPPFIQLLDEAIVTVSAMTELTCPSPRT